MFAGVGGHFQRVRAQKVTRKRVFAGAGGHFQRVRAQKGMRKNVFAGPSHSHGPGCTKMIVGTTPRRHREVVQNAPGTCKQTGTDRDIYAQKYVAMVVAWRHICPYHTGRGGGLVQGRFHEGGDFATLINPKAPTASHTLTCKPILLLESERFANQVATEDSMSSQHLKESTVPKNCPKSAICSDSTHG